MNFNIQTSSPLLSSGAQIQQETSAEVSVGETVCVCVLYVCVNVRMHVCVREWVWVEVESDAGEVWEAKLPNSSAAARELLTGLLGLIVCLGEQGG